MSNKNQHNNRSKEKEIATTIRGIDLFCGVGGLTRGLEAVGIDMSLGIDIDPACEYPYTANNNAHFLLRPVEDITAIDLLDIFGDSPFKLLAGCAPCQPFSLYSQGRSCPSDARWNLLEHFSRLVRETRPHLVTMENVPLLERQDVFFRFVTTLKNEGFEVFYDVVNCADYGVPQQRRRLVLLASKLGRIDIIEPTTPESHRITVKKAIGDLPPLDAGEIYESDLMHQACGLSPLNLQRIRASKPGGTWRDWPESLRAKCHRKASGKTYPSVYGRMTWDEPAPTMTTQFYGYGNGRFGHPEQDRAISLREGAVLQTFPGDYKFIPKDRAISRKVLGTLIGNAVPVKLGKAIGKSIIRHIAVWLKSQEKFV